MSDQYASKFAKSFPAISTSDYWGDRVVTQGHADYCAAYGHAVHIVDGIESPRCPRCGEARETAAPVEEDTQPMPAECADCAERGAPALMFACDDIECANYCAVGGKAYAPAETRPAYHPADMERVRILAGEYAGRFGVVVSFDPSERACYLVTPDAGARNVWLSPYEVGNGLQ